MNNQPFKAGDQVWVGRWIAGEFQRLLKTRVVCSAHGVVYVLDGEKVPYFDPQNVELIRPDLNEKLK